MPGATSRLALPYPLAADPPAGHTQIQALAEAIDNAVVYGQGTLSSRPAAGLGGRIYFATDNDIFYYDTGSTWIAINIIADGSVTTAKLAAEAVTSAKIADNAVGASEIAAGAVGNSELSSGAVDGAKIASSLKPSGGAGTTTEALRALGAVGGRAAAGIHAAQHAPGGADALNWSGGVFSVARPGIRIKRIANQNISNGTDTDIIFTNTLDASGGLTATTTDININKTGFWLVEGCVRWEGNASNARQIYISQVVAGTPQRMAQESLVPGTSSDVFMNIAAIIYADSGDKFRLGVRQISGGALNVVADADTAPWLGAVHIGA